jgi:hypothetical protein
MSGYEIIAISGNCHEESGVDVKSKLGVRESGSGFAERSKIRPAGQRLKAMKLARRIATFRHYTTLDAYRTGVFETS